MPDIKIMKFCQNHWSLVDMGCVPFHTSSVDVKVYGHAVCIHIQHHQCGRAGCIHLHCKLCEHAMVYLSYVSRADVQGVSLSKQYRGAGCILLHLHEMF
jgi:hypothetical protein